MAGFLGQKTLRPPNCEGHSNNSDRSGPGQNTSTPGLATSEFPMNEPPRPQRATVTPNKALLWWPAGCRILDRSMSDRNPRGRYRALKVGPWDW